MGLRFHFFKTIGCMHEVLNKDKIIETLVSNKEQLAIYGVKKIGLFGSFVQNKANENSDIDLLVDIVKEKKPLKTLWV